MSDYLVTDTELISVADAIRAKGETVATLEWPTGYSQAIAAIQTGLDIPQFEVTWDDEGSAVESITCDKTFLECNEYIDAGNRTITVYEHDVSYTYDYRMAGSLRRTNVSYVTYTVVATGSAPAYDLRYNSDGTIDIIEPSSEMGTEGTPTATKGTVSNHVISVTPSVTNTVGYIYGGTKTGTAVTVSASELVSGSETKTANGTYDVTNLAELVVNVSGGGSVTVESLSVTQNGTYTAPTGKAYSPVTVNVSGGGGGGNMSDPIRFFDYDGTLVASYKAVPSALPDVPTHPNLTNGTWNHTLAQISTQFNAMGVCNVGANYDTASGKNEIDVTLDSDHLEPYLSIAVNGTATVDWGDGSPTDTLTGSSFTTLLFLRHTYAQAGSYTISIDGAVGFFGTGVTHPSVLRSTNASTNRRFSRAYSLCVTAVRVADGSRIGAYAFNCCYGLISVTIPASITSIANYTFQNCYSLTSIVIPSGVTSIGNNAFQNCYNLTSIVLPSGMTSIRGSAFANCYSLPSIVIPSGMTSIGSSVFQNCYSLTSASLPDGVTSIDINVFQNCYSLASAPIPDGVTSIGSSAFNYCYSLTSVTIPSDVTSIGNSAFYNCYNVLEYHLLPTTPPSLSGANAFNGIDASAVIYVPQGCLNAYKTATNWSNYASKMVEG